MQFRVETEGKHLRVHVELPVVLRVHGLAAGFLCLRHILSYHEDEWSCTKTGASNAFTKYAIQYAKIASSFVLAGYKFTQISRCQSRSESAGLSITHKSICTISLIQCSSRLGEHGSEQQKVMSQDLCLC